MNRRTLLCALLIGVCGVGISGCGSKGPKLVKVKGKVTYKGKNIAGATVSFYPEKGPMATGITGEDGTFTLTTNGRAGAMPGMNNVGISKSVTNIKSPEQMKPEDMMKMQKEGKGKVADAPKSEIPEKYGDPSQSELKAEVSDSEADNDFTFDLQ